MAQDQEHQPSRRKRRTTDEVLDKCQQEALQDPEKFTRKLWLLSATCILSMIYIIWNMVALVAQ